MKKLFLISLSSILLPLSVVSCSSTQENNNDFNFPKKQKNDFDKNPIINNLLDFFSNNNSNKKQIYVSQQINKSDSKNTELKFSFVYNPIFIFDGGIVQTKVEDLRNTSIKIIKNTLENDWYWTLFNLANFHYIFSPYGDKYTPLDNEKELFDETKNFFGSVSLKINNSKPNKLIKLPYKEIPELKKYSAYSEKESWYLIFDNNKAIKVWKYKENDEPKLRITSDLLVFKDTNNLEQQLVELENQIYSQHLNEFETDYDNYKKYYADEDENEFLMKRNDKKYLEFQAVNQFNNDFVNALNEINKDGIKIFRFTMRDINEKK
ncbi:hypothetical protein N8G13_02195 [Mycoplasma zalophi]|uniref:aromatic motif membrane protein n=1 Tax=Mycoplasma zalophi TaxID=191287 RepID=UPI0021C992A9|nr:aromatic motif membrane protein [Mycoplasma zalophi]MCU4117266.1 hypothetical protein [Mycoplasma zalophi]